MLPIYEKVIFVAKKSTRQVFPAKQPASGDTYDFLSAKSSRCKLLLKLNQALFVGWLVGLLAWLRRNRWTFSAKVGSVVDGSQPRIDLFNFWCRSGWRNRSRNFFSVFHIFVYLSGNNALMVMKKVYLGVWESTIFYADPNKNQDWADLKMIYLILNQTWLK